jgi:hypothetical protein
VAPANQHHFVRQVLAVLQGRGVAIMQTVVLSQLDSLRRELITIAQNGFAAVTFSKVRLLF